MKVILCKNLQLINVQILGYQNRGEWVGAFEFSSDTSSSENISFKVASVSDTGKRKTLVGHVYSTFTAILLLLYYQMYSILEFML